MDPHWPERLVRSSQRANEADEREFLRLVDQAVGVCTLDVARTLMKTFSDTPDFGTQERVISVLATANPGDVTQALLEELPRLVKDAPEWAESLVGLEVEKRPDLLQQVALRMPAEVRDVLRRLIADPAFQSFYPTAKDISV